MKTLGEWRYSSTILDSALDGGEWSASRPCRFTLKETALDAHWIGGWVGPRAGVDIIEKGKILSSVGESNNKLAMNIWLFKEEV
jgi:hypothetical protein